jgi:hypothetical protein
VIMNQQLIVAFIMNHNRAMRWSLTNQIYITYYVSTLYRQECLVGIASSNRSCNVHYVPLQAV